MRYKVKKPERLALTLFVAIVVVCVAQIAWWIYFQAAKNWQAEAWPDGEIQPRHSFQRRMQLRVMARLQRDLGTL